jgi:alkanesulfonate monooxygenase SsuD/methylene tetrahydromethanopterin reductase-like flavin-dependent oxidoreductase (luciferase family)
MIHYGLTLSSVGELGSAADMAHLARLAEESGWDGFFLEDYILFWNNDAWPNYDLWIALAAMAIHTKRITLGTMVTPLNRRRPWKLAREALTLDQLSQGRLVLGIGLGNKNDKDFVKFGEATNSKKLNESLAILTGLLSGEPFSFSGDYFQLGEVQFVPKSVQQPRIPIWIGGGYPLPGPTERAIQYDGSCMYHVPADQQWVDMSPDDIHNLRERVRMTRGNAAADAYTIAVGGRMRGENLDEERAHIRAIEQAGANWWVEHVEVDAAHIMREKVARGPVRI